MLPVLIAALLMAGAPDEGPQVSAPVVFEQEEEGAAEGDESLGADMAPSVPAGLLTTTSATQPVSIDDYSRHYEPPKSDEEARYEAGIENAKRNGQNQLQTLEGAWQVFDANNAPMVHLIFRSTGTGANRRIDGAWRRDSAGAGVESSGFVDSVIEVGSELEISYFPDKTSAPDILHMRREVDGIWRGTLMTPEGKTAPVILRPSP